MLNIEPLLLKIKNRRPVVILAPIAVGVLIGGLLVVKPGISALNGIKMELAGLNQKVSAYQFLLDGEAKTAVYKTRFSGDKTWLIEHLNTLAEKTGFSILSILPEEPKKVGEYLDRTSVRIEAESDYNQLGEFVSHVENLEPYVKILGVDINAEIVGAPAGASGPWQQSTAAKPAARIKTGNIYQISMSVGLFTPASGAL